MQRTALRSIGATFMLAFFSSLLGAKPPPEYPRLSDNMAASQNLEVRKVLSGDVDGIFAIPRTHEMVAAAGGYLWKFSAQGELLDTLRTPGGLSTSGIAFSPLHYTDWVFTGDKQNKTYDPPVDGNTLSPAALWAVLDKADVVEFGKTDTTAWAYVWKAGRAYILNINSNRKQVDTYCTQRTHSAEKLGWNATCLDNYKTRPQAWAEVEPESFADFDETPPRVKVAGFNRRKYHLEEGLSGQLFGLTLGAALKLAGVPGSLPGRYWFGDALTQLRVGQEVVKFKTFIPYEDGDYRYFYNTRWWEPAPGVAGVSPWFSVHMRTYMERAGEEGLLKYYEKDIGLYVARPKGTGQPAATQGMMPAWRPVFEGPATRNAAVTGMIEFGAQPPAHYWLRDPEPSKRYPEMPPKVEVRAPWPDLRQLPTALVVQWRGTRDDESTLLRVEFDAQEAAIAFNTLRTNKVQTVPLELVLQVPDMRGTLDGMQVQLRSGSTALPLTKARFSYVVKPPVEKVSDHELRGVLQTATAAAKLPGAAGLPAFLKQAQSLAQDKERAEALAPNVTAAYAELINDYNAQRDFKAGAALVRHYLTQIHPYIGHYSSDPGQTYNITVIASQTLAIYGQLAPKDKDLVPAVIAKLLGPDFDPQKQTNGTLMYNLACHYAVTKDKPHMLQSISAARRLGKPTSQFMADTDFTQYWKDSEFLKAVEQTPPAS